MLESYSLDVTTGRATFTIPAGISDVEAMKALNEYFRTHLPHFERDAIYASDFDWYEKLPERFPHICEKHDLSQARQVTIEAVVTGSKNQPRDIQALALESNSLEFADPRYQAIAAALEACKNAGADLFQGLWVRGSLSQVTLGTDQELGIIVNRQGGNHLRHSCAASGTPTAEQKQLDG